MRRGTDRADAKEPAPSAPGKGRQDARFMALALAMAARGLGRTAPNPAVGAVLTSPCGTQVLARGWTQPGGRPHAEVVALEAAGERARGATLYVTLEPCAHHGKTPPCADAVVSAGVARVVCAQRDPDPRVAGRGIERLRAAGIEVVEGVGAQAARRLTLGHILRVTRARPQVTVKFATDAAGQIAPGDGGTPVWVTGLAARAVGHLLRAEHDAILVGRRTVVADNPALTCRLPGLGAASPVRVVMDTQLRLAEEVAFRQGQAALLRQLAQAPLWLAAAPDADAGRRETLQQAGAEVLSCARDAEGQVDVIALCRELAERGVTRLLVEGGGRVAASFLKAGLVDEIVLFTAPRRLDTNSRPALPAGLDLAAVCAAQFHLRESRQVGTDRMEVFARAGREAGEGVTDD